MKDMYYTRSSKGELGLCKEGNYAPQEHVKYCQKQGYDVINASYDIIDILKVGDYVNGYKIGYIDNYKGAMREFYYDYENPKEDVGHWEEEIKSVVTKELFENMKYRIGE